MISALEISSDPAGFPIVAWTEVRGIASPEGPGRARVECRIMKEATTGMLLFVARGAVRHGKFEDGKAWEGLRSFSVHAAENLYYSQVERHTRQHLAGKGLASKLLWSDGAQVLLAEFGGEVPLHVNCADASPVDVERLHVTLTREFIGKQHDRVSRLCGDMYLWPANDDRVMTYDPQRRGWDATAEHGNKAGTLGTLLANLIMGGVALAMAGLLVGLALTLAGVW